MVTLLCPVRGCRRPLARQGRRLICLRRHSFDVARSGYVNLLQVQDRRSARPGDAAEILRARRRFLARGFETPLVDALTDLVSLTPRDAALEVGCGEGDYLAAVAGRSGCVGHGLDISTDAIDAAARRYPHLHWIVGNGDRVLPYADASFALVLSVTGRRNAGEFRRVLAAAGRLLVVVPGPDDLIELRAAVLGEGVARDRVEAALAALAPLFALERRQRLRHVVRLDAADARDVMAGTYRALRASRRARLTALGELDVTLSRDALLFRPAGRRGGGG
ncbi:MAG TPA: methyltransferase domain-containing protein [Methylomirabilota bacterium]|nr:methyltransferase domain-containing protein [Methylomirabilota bacterium]